MLKPLSTFLGRKNEALFWNDALPEPDQVGASKPVRRRFAGAAMLSIWLLCGASASASSFQILKAFDRPPAEPWGGVVADASGNIYGVADIDGAKGGGVVYKVSTNGVLAILHEFGGDNDAGPEGRLVWGTNGYLYGVTYVGGPTGSGSVYKLGTNGQFTTLAYFNGIDGLHPQSGMVLASDGNLYGTTYGGGANDQGLVYRVNHSGNLQAVFSFSGSAGVNPGWNAELCRAADGNLYGTTRAGGTNGQGVIFRVSMAGNVTTLVDLGGPLTVRYPLTGLVQSTDGYLYGATDEGGDYDYGAFFRVDLAGHLTTLGSFDGANAYGALSTLMEASDGNFYGTSDSQVFRITRAGAITTLFESTTTFGTGFEGTLLEGADHNLYGTASNDGPGYRGIVFRVSFAGAAQTLASFVAPDGSAPHGKLVWGADGNIYGTCVQDGSHSVGTVFRITPAGGFTTIHHFDGLDGDSPTALTTQEGRTFYGVTGAGGVYGEGTLFQITTNGAFAALASFDHTNGSDPESLILANDGNLYGTTSFGGPNGDGVVFKFQTNGMLSTLHPSSAPTGDYPSSLVQGLDGKLYGTAANGPFQGGVVFQLGLDGSYSLVHAFDSAMGYFPGDGLAIDAEGRIYAGIVGDSQPLFCLKTNGTISTVGFIPDYFPRGLMLGADGNIYGASWLGGSGGGGSVWVMNRNGRLARLVSFDKSNGGSLRSGPLLGGDGRLYGVAEDDGPGGGGVVYALTFSIPEIVAQPLPQGVFTNGATVFDVIVFSTNMVSYQWLRDGAPITGATNATFSIGHATAADLGSYSVQVTSAGKSVLSSGSALTFLPTRPQLTILRQPDGVLMSWPAAYIGFNVEQSSNLAAGSWSPLGFTTSSNNGVFSVSVTNVAGAGPGFFRLKK